MNEVLQDMFDLSLVLDLLDPTGAAHLLLVLLIFIAARKIFDAASPYALSEELTTKDNKAIAVSFGGYVFGVGLILYAVLTHEGPTQPGSIEETHGLVPLLWDFASTLGWGLLGILLLNLSRIINNKILLSKFDNTKELVTDRNIGTGAVECGSFVGSALMIQAALSGEDSSFIVAIISTLIFFVLGQVGFILFGILLQKVTRFDLHHEIEIDNAAAGVSFGFSLVAIGILLSGYIKYSDSVLGFGLWFLVSSFVLLASRYLIDKAMLPGDLLDDEISRDQNWGAALVEGLCTVAVAFIASASFF
jgi:uncharacterized membrane protein YjfL (UPF0719 family)